MFGVVSARSVMPTLPGSPSISSDAVCSDRVDHTGFVPVQRPDANGDPALAGVLGAVTGAKFVLELGDRASCR